MSTWWPAIRMYLLKTSEGTPNPATWPMWRGPLAYGQATADRTCVMEEILGVPRDRFLAGHDAGHFHPSFWPRGAVPVPGSRHGEGGPDRTRSRGGGPAGGDGAGPAGRLRGGRVDRGPLADPDHDVRPRHGRPDRLRVVVPRHHRHR